MVLWSEVARGGEASGARARAGVPCRHGWHGHAMIGIGMGKGQRMAWAQKGAPVDDIAPAHDHGHSGQMDGSKTLCQQLSSSLTRVNLATLSIPP